MLLLVIAGPLLLLGLCAICACVLGGRCEAALDARLGSRVYRLPERRPEVADEPSLRAHG